MIEMWGSLATSRPRYKHHTPFFVLGRSTGVGKSSILEFIASVFDGNEIDNINFDIADHTNEQGGSNN